MSELLLRVDLWVIVLYMLAMLFIGWWVSDGSRDVEGYSVGNREMNGWVVGLSVLGTFLSSITFLALPARVFASHDWSSYAFGMALPVAALVAVHWFIPLYRRRVSLSAYEFLEQRFGYWARGVAAGSYTVLQLIRVAMVNLLVALAVDPLLDWGIIPTIITVGAVVIVYDVMGGLKAVIWTDVVQAVVLFGAALWCVVEVIGLRPGGWSQFMADLPAGSMSLGTIASTDLSQGTFLVILLYGISENLRNYGTDQNYVQRMLSARDEQGPKTSIWFGALSYLPISLIFCLIGTGLWMLYRVPVGASELVGEALTHTPLPEGIKPDQVFPHFIRHELSPLARGIVIAGILAAAMSTVDSCLNSMSVTLFVDLWRRLLPKGSSTVPDILILRGFTLFNGVLGTGLAIFIYLLYLGESGALMDLWWKYAGVAGSGLFGLFLLAWLMPQIPSWGALVALLCSVPVLAWGMTHPAQIHGNLVGIAGFATMLLVGLAFRQGVALGLLSPNSRES